MVLSCAFVLNNEARCIWTVEDVGVMESIVNLVLGVNGLLKIEVVVALLERVKPIVSV
jgi:hypothetical protein